MNERAERAMGRGIKLPSMAELEAIGLSPLEERCYRALIERGPNRLAGIAAELTVPVSKLRSAVAALELKGFVTRTPGRGSTLVPARPDLAVEALILRREQELDEVRLAAARLAEEFAGRSSGAPSERPVELITGREAVAQWWVQVQRSAQLEVRIFDLPPYVSSSTQRNPVQAELLPRGISYRVLYDETSIDDPGKVEAARASVADGELARVIDGVPIKLIIADASLALTHDSAEVHENAVIVHPSALLRGLIALFEALWFRAVPLRFDGAGGDDALDGTDRSILSLLAAGSKDERIAHQLGIGLRTVRRRVATLMEAVGARTRFQVALRAKERGWL
jgi:sugar-specific transcriptional regulator TrmB/DNA-binding CsgD family transcriptional regulator